MTRIVKIVAMLAVYLVWIFSNSAIALSCHANHAEHIHCCEKMHFEAPHGCHHDHSNTIVLYDTTKERANNIEPAEINITAKLEDNIAIEDIVLKRTSRHYERKVPIAESPTLLGCVLRAPPVIA